MKIIHTLFSKDMLNKLNVKLVLLVSNALLLVAVLFLLVKIFLCPCSEGDMNTCNPKVPSAKSSKLAIAYINVDSLLHNYDFAKEANESLIKKQEDSRLNVNTKARQLQSEMSEFQRKLEANAFLSRERAEQEQMRLVKRQQELQELDAKLTQQLLKMQQDLNGQMKDTINAFLKEFNKDNKYELILSNTAGDNVLHATKGYDITNEVIEALNERYESKKNN